MALTARAHDCGPEPSLRTAPSSSSLRPTAAAFRFPRAHRGCALSGPPRRRAADVLDRGAARNCLNHECRGARRVPAARAASLGIRVGGRLGGGRFRGFVELFANVPPDFWGRRKVARSAHCLAHADPLRATHRGSSAGRHSWDEKCSLNADPWNADPPEERTFALAAKNAV